MRLMARRSFVNELVIRAEPGQVLAAVSDPLAFARLNPLVVEVTIDPARPGFYHVVDRFGRGRLALRTRYRAWMAVVEDGIDSAAWSFPRVHLRSTWRFLPHAQGTLARESVEITAPAPVAGFVARTAQDAHRDLLLALKARVEGRDS
jgi:hypothetical protein